MRFAPAPSISADGVVSAFVAEPPQLLKNPDQRHPLARRRVRVRRQQPIINPASAAAEPLAQSFVPPRGAEGRAGAVSFAPADEGSGAEGRCEHEPALNVCEMGLKELVAEVLADNVPMLKVFERSGLAMTTKHEGSVVHVTLRYN